MNRNLKLRTLVFLAAAALAVPTFAKPTATTITIGKSAKIGKADLQAGEYKLMIDGDKAPSKRVRTWWRSPPDDGKTATARRSTTPF